MDKVWTCMLAEKRSGNLCIASSGIEEIPASPLRKFLESSEAFAQEPQLMSWSPPPPRLLALLVLPPESMARRDPRALEHVVIVLG